MAITGGFDLAKTSTTGSETQTDNQTNTSQKVLSQDAINKLIYDVASADQGFASLATGENLAGGYAASTKALLAQDFMVKLVGELANVTAKTVTTETGTATKQSKASSTKASGGLKTVICTELHRQGLLSSALYNHPAATAHFRNLHPYTIAGYHIWGMGVAERMRTSKLLSYLMLPVAKARYEMVTSGRFNLLGAATIYIGQPVCFVIGFLANLGARYGHIGA
jgi:hypothetical protein